MRNAQGTKEWNPKKAIYPCYASIKEDGVRVLKDDVFYTRNHNVVIGIDHIKPRFIDGLDHALDGEGLVLGKIFDEASGLIRNHKAVPDAHYMVFDAPDIPGTLQERYMWLYENLIESDHVNLIDHVICNSEQELMDFYNMAIANGHEGIMYKDMSSMYEGKKSWSWMRLVPIHSADCIVVGMFEGRGKHIGRAGGIIVLFQGHEVKVGTGFSDRQRDELWVQQGNAIGQIAKCEYKEKTKAGAMRQPRFKGWRWDKNEVDS